jgi:hypothetical protein
MIVKSVVACLQLAIMAPTCFKQWPTISMLKLNKLKKEIHSFAFVKIVKWKQDSMWKFYLILF